MGSPKYVVGWHKVEAAAGGIVLGPNLLLTPNGPYASGNWTPTALTETTGQTDPFGGTTASLPTDTAVASQHTFTQSPVVATNQKYLVQCYFKPGTYTGGIAISVSTGNNTQSVNVTNLGVMTQTFGTISNMQVTSVGGFFFCSFNCVTGATTANAFGVGFGTGGAPFLSYTGTVQNQTFWGISLQPST